MSFSSGWTLIRLQTRLHLSTIKTLTSFTVDTFNIYFCKLIVTTHSLQKIRLARQKIENFHAVASRFGYRKHRSLFCHVKFCPIGTIFTFLELADQPADFLSIRVKNVDSCQNVNKCKTSIRVLPRHPLSDWDDFYLFEIGRLNCRTFVFCPFMSKT